MDFGEDGGSPKTPKGKLFNPFAPASEDMLLAPMCKKYYDDFQATMLSRFNLDHSFAQLNSRVDKIHHVDAIVGEVLMEEVHRDLMQIIVSSSIESVYAELLDLHLNVASVAKSAQGKPRMDGSARRSIGNSMIAAGTSRRLGKILEFEEKTESLEE